MGKQPFILPFKGFVLTLGHVCNKEEEISVNISKFRFEKGSRTFVKHKEKDLAIEAHGGSTHSLVRVVKFESVLEKTTGLKQPFLLLEEQDTKVHHHSKGSYVYRGFYLVNFNSFVEVGRFSADYSILGLQLQVRVCDGPSMCWTNSDSLNFARKTTCHSVFEISSHKIVAEPNVKINMLWCGHMDGRLIAMVTAKNDMRQSSINWICVDHSIGVISDNNTAPNAYASVITCCAVTSCNDVWESMDTSNAYQADANDDIILAGTSMGQLVEFTRGRLTNHCQIPFDDPAQICIVEAESCLSLVLVKSKTNKVCAVSFSDKKVKMQWENIHSVLVDDFFHSGGEQVLLLQQPLGGQDLLQSFILSDLCGQTISSDHEMANKMPQSSHVESLQKTVQALKYRQQASNAQLREYQMEYNEKQLFIEDTCRVLHRNTQPSPEDDINALEIPTKMSTGMVCLVEGCADSDGDQEQAEASKSGRLDVATTWKRVITDNVVVGIELLNNRECKVFDLTLALVSCRQDCMKSHCTTTCKTNDSKGAQDPDAFQEDTNDVPPSPKRRKTGDDGKRGSGALLPGQKTSVVAVTSLPKFIKEDSYSWSLVLSWRCYPEGGGVERQEMCCGSVSLTIDDVLEGRFDVGKKTGYEAAERDVTAVKAVSTETKILFRSTLSSLTHVTSMIRGGLGLTAGAVCDVISRDSKWCLLDAAKGNGPLKGVAMVIHILQNQARIRLFTRNTNQVHLVLHQLRHTLPDDVTIDIDSSADDTSLAHAVFCLHQEVDALSTGLRDMINNGTSGTKTATSLPVQGNMAGQSKEDRLQGIREQFESKRQCGVSSKEKFIAPREGGRFWTSVVESATQTNNAMVELVDTSSS